MMQEQNNTLSPQEQETYLTRIRELEQEVSSLNEQTKDLITLRNNNPQNFGKNEKLKLQVIMQRKQEISEEMERDLKPAMFQMDGIIRPVPNHICLYQALPLEDIHLKSNVVKLSLSEPAKTGATEVIFKKIVAGLGYKDLGIDERSGKVIGGLYSRERKFPESSTKYKIPVRLENGEIKKEAGSDAKMEEALENTLTLPVNNSNEKIYEIIVRNEEGEITKNKDGSLVKKYLRESQLSENEKQDPLTFELPSPKKGAGIDALEYIPETQALYITITDINQFRKVFPYIFNEYKLFYEFNNSPFLCYTTPHAVYSDVYTTHIVTPEEQLQNFRILDANITRYNGDASKRFFNLRDDVMNGEYGLHSYNNAHSLTQEEAYEKEIGDLQRKKEVALSEVVDLEQKLNEVSVKLDLKSKEHEQKTNEFMEFNEFKGKMEDEGNLTSEQLDKNDEKLDTLFIERRNLEKECTQIKNEYSQLKRKLDNQTSLIKKMTEFDELYDGVPVCVSERYSKAGGHVVHKLFINHHSFYRSGLYLKEDTSSFLTIGTKGTYINFQPKIEVLEAEYFIELLSDIENSMAKVEDLKNQIQKARGNDKEVSRLSELVKNEEVKLQKNIGIFKKQKSNYDSVYIKFDSNNKITLGVKKDEINYFSDKKGSRVGESYVENTKVNKPYPIKELTVPGRLFEITRDIKRNVLKTETAKELIARATYKCSLNPIRREGNLSRTALELEEEIRRSDEVVTSGARAERLRNLCDTLDIQYVNHRKEEGLYNSDFSTDSNTRKSGGFDVNNLPSNESASLFSNKKEEIEKMDQTPRYSTQADLSKSLKR